MNSAPAPAHTPSPDEVQMAHCAIRYCLGRMTYVVGDGIRWARRYAPHSPWLQDVLIRDIEAAERAGGLGSQGDAEDWLALLADLRAMQASRAL